MFEVQMQSFDVTCRAGLLDYVRVLSCCSFIHGWDSRVISEPSVSMKNIDFKPESLTLFPQQ
jgi:hypothetical protein